jgi:hypothetical protein
VNRKHIFAGLLAASAMAGSGWVAKAQLGGGFADPRVPATVETATRDAAVSAVRSTPFPADPFQPTPAPLVGQLRSGTAQLHEIAPGVMFGTSVPLASPSKGYFLARPNGNGGYVTVTGPEPRAVSAAGYDGTDVVLLTDAGVFSAAAVAVAAGNPIWARRSNVDASVFGNRGTTESPKGDPEIAHNQLSCFASACIVQYTHGFGTSSDEFTGKPESGTGATFDGFQTFAFDGDDIRGTEVGAAGNLVVTDSGFFAVPGTPIHEDGYSVAINFETRPTVAHWSTIRNSFISVRTGQIIAWRPDSAVETLVPSAASGLADAVELPDGTLVELRTDGTNAVVSRNGTESFRFPIAPDPTANPQVMFGSYAGGQFLTIASDPYWPTESTLLASTDGGTTWHPTPGPSQVVDAIPGTTTSTTITTATTTTTPVSTTGASSTTSASTTTTAVSTTVPTPARASLFASATTGTGALRITGSNNTFAARVHANLDVTLTGSQNKLLGGTEYGTTFTATGSQNTFTPAAARTPAAPVPVTFSIADYQPGGRAATAAGAAYHPIPASQCTAGTWTLPATAAGLYYVPCAVKATNSGGTATLTVIATGSITLTGSTRTINAFTDGIVFATNTATSPAISLTGSTLTLSGNIISTNGPVTLTGSTNTITGTVIGTNINLSGSNTRFL